MILLIQMHSKISSGSKSESLILMMVVIVHALIILKSLKSQ